MKIILTLTIPLKSIKHIFLWELTTIFQQKTYSEHNQTFMATESGESQINKEKLVQHF